MDDKRLIEVDFPLKEVSEESVREKNIRHGHISTLHVWWARRPLAASRATIFAALIPAPKNDNALKKKLDFVVNLSKWENSLNRRLIEKARKEIRDFFGGEAPKILDCFAGGGAIPLEALRLGCETYALELNPVAVLILKAILEYPQKFGKKKAQDREDFYSASNPLIEDVKKWGNWVLEETRKEIGKFYPPDPDGSIPVAYIWARTIRCQNPACNAEIPLISNLWLARKVDEEKALKMVVDKKKIEFKIAKGKEIDFNPSQGTTKRATVLCPVCGAGMDGKSVRKEGGKGKLRQRLLALALRKPKTKGKIYRIASEHDIKVFQQAEKYFKEKIKFLKWDLYPIPDEEIDPNSVKPRTLWLYGMPKWGDLFNSRQKLALVTLVEKIRIVHQKLLEKGNNYEYTNAVITYLALL